MIKVQAQAALSSSSGLDSNLGVGAMGTGVPDSGPLWTGLVIGELLSSRPATPGRFASPRTTGTRSSPVQTGPPY